MTLYDCIIFIIKHKTSYEMRISDWSSDVCSSDLIDQAIQRIEERIDDLGAQLLVLVVIIENAAIQRHFAIEQCGLEACFVIDQRFLRDGGILRERSGGDARETSRLVPFRNIGVEQERRRRLVVHAE